MATFRVRQVAVLGAGVMGAQIAAHCANAKVPVLLFDLGGQDANAKNAVVDKAIAGLKSLKPAPLAHPELAQYIRAANYDEHLHWLADCDVVIEAIAERMDWKAALYQRVAPHVAPHAVFATNTSGLSIATLSESLPAALHARFCGVHFFNPPRYMHLCEIIPLPNTRADILDSLETFLTQVLGKGVVRAKDTPNFIANRVGIAGMLATMLQAEKRGIPLHIVDELTGSKLGRAKSATFRTADVVGLDTMLHVIKTMQTTLTGGPNADPFAASYATPALLQALVDRGALGQKTKAGVFKKEGQGIASFNLATGQYEAQQGTADASVLAMLKTKDPGQRLAALRSNPHPQAQFLWAVFRDLFHYVAVHTASIAHTVRDVDFCLRWGFGWAQGPFELWQAAGWQTVAQWVQSDIDAGLALCREPLPAWALAEPVASHGVYTAQGAFNPSTGGFEARSTLPVYQRQVFRAPVLGETSLPSAHTVAPSNIVKDNEAARLWVAPGHSDVLVMSIKTKMHVISPQVIDTLHEGIHEAERHYAGLVLWSADEPFSAGADLQGLAPAFMQGGAQAIEPMVRQFQEASQALRYAQVPVVAALAGLVLGGGCEFAMHCAARVAHLETYMGLVEVGVGLIPAGGGLKAIAQAAAQQAAQWGSADYLLFLKQAFERVATAAVSTSALEARSMGYLQPGDPIVANIHELLFTALHTARSLSTAGYRPPVPGAQFAVAGSSVCATLQAQVLNLQQGGFISEHDALLANSIATVLCGGPNLAAGTLVDEAWLLRLEREHFLSLLATPKTQQRLMGMLQTGKPVRN